MLRSPEHETGSRSGDVRAGRGQRGFSLLEVLIAFAVFSIGILAVASMSTVVVRETGFTGSSSVARAIARERMALLLAAPRDELVNFSGSSLEAQCERTYGVLAYEPDCTATYNATQQHRVELQVRVRNPMGFDPTNTYSVRLNSTKFIIWE